MSFMAPQAYTKETLVKAFDWLQHQPANVKQVATSPDVLVGLYLKAQRQGIVNIDVDAPVSSKKFIDDLKSLKKDFAQFEEPRSAQANVTPMAPVAPTVVTEEPAPNYTPPPPPQQATSSPVFHNNILIAQQPSSPRGPQEFDEKTRESLDYIQQRFNLSSRQEALRMAIAVGIQRISRWD